MVKLFDSIKNLLGIKANAEEKIEPVVSQPAEVQVNEPTYNLTDGKAYFTILRGEPDLPKQIEEVRVRAPDAKAILPGEPEPPKQVEEVTVQAQGSNHSHELELLKHYAELAKQNKMDSDALNEDLE